MNPPKAKRGVYSSHGSSGTDGQAGAVGLPHRVPGTFHGSLPCSRSQQAVGGLLGFQRFLCTEGGAGGVAFLVSLNLFSGASLKEFRNTPVVPLPHGSHG